MKLTKLAIYAVLAIAVGHLFAAQISFSSGTPALAADVNANFAELYNAKWTRTGADLSYTTGNVGIGVATPANALEISGGGITLPYSTIHTGSIRFRNSGGTPVNILGLKSVSDVYLRTIDNAATAGLVFQDSAGTDVFKIQNDGKVGIGTSTPANKLDVVGVISATRLNITENAAGVQVGSLINANSTGAGLYVAGGSGTGTAFQVDNYNGGSNLLRVLGNGNIGIGGVTSPTGLLNIGGVGTATQRVFIRGSGTTGGTHSLVTTDSSSIDTFYIRDDGFGYLKAASWTYGSDVRMKENIQYFHTGLDRIVKLRPTKFDYKNGVKNQFGFIAQDVQKIIPEAVSVIDPRTGMLGLKTDLIVPLLVNAVQELKREIDAENARLLSLSKQAEKRATAAEARAAKLEKQLAEESTARQRQDLRLAQLEQSFMKLAHSPRIPSTTLRASNSGAMRSSETARR